MKNYKEILSILILAFVNTYSYGQESKKNSIYVEVGGNAIVYSINYDRLIPISKQLKFVPRAGFEYFPQHTNSDYSGVIIPFETNVLWAKHEESKNFVEAGIGLSLIGMRNYLYNTSKNVMQKKVKFANVSLVRLGFRHQKPIGGFLYRVGLLVPISQDSFSKSVVGDDIFLRLYGGISLGYSF